MRSLVKVHRNFHLISAALLNLFMVLVLTSCSKKHELPPDFPKQATTYPASFITQTAATLNGDIRTLQKVTTYSFQYGTTTSYTKSIPGSSLAGRFGNILPEDIIVHSTLTGLSPGTIYYYSLRTEGYGISNGEDASFTTLIPGESGIIFNPDLIYGSVSDNDGNTYKTIQIGTQTWIAENLKTTKFNDGTYIQLVENNTQWENLNAPAYCWYDNDISIYKIHTGALYNYYAVNSSKLCPVGWHVPAEAEWETLITYLGGDSLDVVKLNETGATHWIICNPQSLPRNQNLSGFTALPGGYRDPVGWYDFIGVNGEWWSSTEDSATGRVKDLNIYVAGFMWTSSDKINGESVRCIKDN
jgi:uncharacterized protein (TIGR02145 family)